MKNELREVKKTPKPTTSWCKDPVSSGQRTENQERLWSKRDVYVRTCTQVQQDMFSRDPQTRNKQLSAKNTFKHPHCRRQASSELCSSDPFLPSTEIFYFAFLKCQEKNRPIFPSLDLFHLESLHDHRTVIVWYGIGIKQELKYFQTPMSSLNLCCYTPSPGNNQVRTWGFSLEITEFKYL